MRYGPRVKKSIDRVIKPTDGLGGIRVLRQPPAAIPRGRHGNWVHGRYSKAPIEEMHEVRRCAKIIWGRSTGLEVGVIPVLT
jgi:hypothetical protein